MQHKQRFTNVTLVTPYGEEDKDLLIDGDKIVDILNPNENISDDWKIIDGQNNFIFPGMIDVLQHGFLNYLYGHAEENCTVDNSKILPSVGVTGFLPSIIFQSSEIFSEGFNISTILSPSISRSLSTSL